jgi:hypothetical protein
LGLEVHNGGLKNSGRLVFLEGFLDHFHRLTTFLLTRLTIFHLYYIHRVSLRFLSFLLRFYLYSSWMSFSTSNCVSGIIKVRISVKIFGLLKELVCFWWLLLRRLLLFLLFSHSETHSLRIVIADVI